MTMNITLSYVLTVMNLTGFLDPFVNRTSLRPQEVKVLMNPYANTTSFEYDDVLYDYLTEIAANNEFYCHLSFAFLEYPATEAGQIYCNSTWDSVTCWPTTAAGHLAEVSCPSVVEDIKYDSTQNATRWCFENGTWQEKSDYTRCAPLALDGSVSNHHNLITRLIYYVGFTTSLVALVIALAIFLYFRSLRCLRNTIHCHLIVTFMVRNILWMVMNYQLLKINDDPNNEVIQWICKLTMTVYNYMQVTNFFWMLVEGLYLHTLIVFAFSVEKIKLWHYAILGWCVPAVVIIVWAAVKANYENKRCWLPMDDTYYDYIYIVPILIVLLINVIFLGSIVCVMMSKLRASNTLQTRQYRKAVRATLILFPLLGVTYVVFITPPNDDKVSKNIFVYFNAVLQSTQGLLVAIFYCFMNGEVRAAIKQKFTRWQDHRSIATRYTRASIANAEQLGLKRPSVATNTSALGNGRLSSGSVMTGSSKDCVSAQSADNVDKENGVNQLTMPILKDEAV